MGKVISKTTDSPKASRLEPNGLEKHLDKYGRQPKFEVYVYPLEASRKSFLLDRILTYQFSSSVLIPVDTFSFSVVAPDDTESAYDSIKEGDQVRLYSNDVLICTGIIDIVDIEVDGEYGERVLVQGRDLAAYLEDQDAITLGGDPLYFQQVSVKDVGRKLITNTRINTVITQQVPRGQFVFCAEPTETKIAALQRFLEPLNLIFWVEPDGTLMIGKPDMAQKPRGLILCSKKKKDSNVLSIKASYKSTNIPNQIVPLWAAEEAAKARIGKERILYNNAEGPTRLNKAGHKIMKTVMTSIPNGADQVNAQEGTNILRSTKGNVLKTMALREMARRNQEELIVQAQVVGHTDNDGNPYLADTVYQVEFDRAKINQQMYLFAVDYNCGEDQGQRTTLSFCKLNTICANVASDPIVRDLNRTKTQFGRPVTT